MIDLYLLCAELKAKQSPFRQHSKQIIAEIYSYFNRPSQKTKEVIAGWKHDFRYIYGDITTNLSSNRKLKRDKLLQEYEIPAVSVEAEITAVQLLFFSIQTYFSLLIKYIMGDILRGVWGGRAPSYEEIIRGDFSQQYGIANYGCADWYCWPLFELGHGFAGVMERIECHVEKYRSAESRPDFYRAGSYDFIKQIYEAVIPKELRHALGEYYTPDWLAESTLTSAIDALGADKIRTLSVIDPTCGSGTFLFQAIMRKRQAGSTLSDILGTVRGIDINPLAVLTAKTNYLLSVLDLLDGLHPITIPVYQGDIVALSAPAEAGTGREVFYDQHPSGAIRNRLARDRAAIQRLEKSDLVVGNPPWVNWEYMPEQYRQGSQHIWLEYQLFSAKGRDLSFSKEDISVLITYIVMDRLLKDGGVIGFVIRQGVFKSAQNGAGFRRFKIRDGGVKVLKVEDLSKLRVFEHSSNRTALFFARKGEDTVYPVPYCLWEKRAGLKSCSFGAYVTLREVMDQVSVVQQWAVPAVKEDRTSLWITASRDSLRLIERALGTNGYRARTGVFTGGANAVYWLRILARRDGLVSVTNVVERAKRKSEQITADLETDYVFPMLKGGGVRRWKIDYDTYLLCPHTAETRMRPVPQTELAERAPRTLEYLQHFKEDLDGRKGFAGWEKDIQEQEFHAILRVGAYTFSSYKVIWKYIAPEFICAVISSVDDPFLGVKPILPNEKIMYVSLEDEQEAYYLCGLLSSTLIAQCVKSYMNPTSISAHVLNKLNIPAFDANDPVHREIARLCKAGHGKEDISPYIAAIDRLVEQLYAV